MDKPLYEINREERSGHGRYFIRLAPGIEAEMLYRRAGESPMVIAHTGVPHAYEGRGIAARLVQAAITDAREEGFKITPLCSYVADQFRRHPEWQDLLA